jgi:proteasome assembly chaperone (PAC2) family protein
VDESVKIWEKPVEDQVYLIAGWRQWADAGSISSGLPPYLTDQLEATKIGEITSDDFYLFQIPGTHHLLRPVVKLEEGYPQSMEVKKNEFFYADSDGKGLITFIGDEPHLKIDRYADAFFDAVDYLGIKRVIAVGGVYGAMPYDKDRDISCAYSLREMKDELSDYAVRFSEYEGGTTIGTYLVDQAKRRGIEFVVFYAFVPAYDFSQPSLSVQGMRIETDFKAWYDLARRFNHMFDVEIELAELERRSTELRRSMDAKISELERKLPQLEVREYLAELDEEFTERHFSPLGDVWERGLSDLFGDESED